MAPLHHPTTSSVSVVTPVYNRADTIGACLASVAAQTRPPIEHLVVDGGSTDDTIAVVSAFAASHDLPYKLSWTSEPDDGMYDAINKGLRSTTGEVLTYLNSDDAWFPWTLEVGVSALAAGADLAFGDLALLQHDARGARAWVQFYPDFDLAHYTHVGTLAQPTVVWRREVSERIGWFDDDYRLLGDCEYWLRAAVAGFRFVHVGDVQAVQVEHAGTLRATQAEKLQQEFRRLRAAYRPHAGPPPSEFRRRLTRSLQWRVAQLRLLRQLGREQPEAWPRFVHYVRDQHLEVDRRRLLQFQLPERWRPADTTWLDAAALAHALDVDLG